jgi:hypothetical protein
MKKLLLSITLLSMLPLCIYPQCNPSYYTGSNVYTCNNVAIATTIPSCEWTSAQKATIKSALLAEYASMGITSADILDEASTVYNCHAYAWHLTEGNTNKVWINQTDNGNANLSKYWGSNACFTLVSTTSYDKIFYYSGDHSAVKSTVVSGKYESKWGQLPLVRHAPTSVPSAYKGNERRYYMRNISGPAVVCSGSPATFTVSSAPSSGFTWDKSSNLTLVSSSGNSATFSASGNGSGCVRILVNGIEIAQKTVYVGAPVSTDITASCGPETNNKYYGSAAARSTPFVGDQYEWMTDNSGWTIIQHPNADDLGIPMNGVQITPPYTSASTILRVRAHNACGWGTWKQVGTLSGSSYYSMSAYPNPVNSTLNVEVTIDAQAHAQALSQASAQLQAAGAGSVKQTPTFDIRLYNGRGVLLRQASSQAGTVTFDVSGLPEDTYYLHVYDDTQTRPEIQQVIIRH